MKIPFLQDFVELFFPKVCCVCGSPLVGDEHSICCNCLLNLPEALTAQATPNYLEYRLAGRIPIEHASALLIFKKESGTQQILHPIQYQDNQKLAITMGRQLGATLTNSGKYNDVDFLVPVPLHPSKERKRGYNQSLLLCKGIQQTFFCDIEDTVLIRNQRTESQTRKNREERLENMRGVFSIRDKKKFEGKHIMLVDDVVTTGATTEACWQALKDIEGIRISIAALAVAGDT